MFELDHGWNKMMGLTKVLKGVKTSTRWSINNHSQSSSYKSSLKKLFILKVHFFRDGIRFSTFFCNYCVNISTILLHSFDVFCVIADFIIYTNEYRLMCLLFFLHMTRSNILVIFAVIMPKCTI